MRSTSLMRPTNLYITTANGLHSKSCFLESIENPYNPTTSLYIMKINLLQPYPLNSYYYLKNYTFNLSYATNYSPHNTTTH